MQCCGLSSHAPPSRPNADAIQRKPPPQDPAPGAAWGQQQKKEQQPQAGAPGAAANGEGSSTKTWAAAAAGAVALAGLSAGLYFAPENLFKPKESTTGMQQPAPATVRARPDSLDRRVRSCSPMCFQPGRRPGKPPCPQ